MKILDPLNEIMTARIIAGRHDLLYDHNGNKMIERRYTLIRDLERCPYTPIDSGYDDWIKKDDTRLRKLNEARHNLYIMSMHYLQHEDPVIRGMAIFIRELWDEK